VEVVGVIATNAANQDTLQTRVLVAVVEAEAEAGMVEDTLVVAVAGEAVAVAIVTNVANRDTFQTRVLVLAVAVEPVAVTIEVGSNPHGAAKVVVAAAVAVVVAAVGESAVYAGKKVTPNGLVQTSKSAFFRCNTIIFSF
jgi:hypothetical protein